MLMQYRLVKRKEFEMELCLREKNRASAVICTQKLRSFEFEDDSVCFQDQLLSLNKIAAVLIRIFQYFNH